MALHPRKLSSSHLRSWEPEISQEGFPSFEFSMEADYCCFWRRHLWQHILPRVFLKRCSSIRKNTSCILYAPSWSLLLLHEISTRATYSPIGLFKTLQCWKIDSHVTFSVCAPSVSKTAALWHCHQGQRIVPWILNSETPHTAMFAV
jgi:hypothetical protein